MRLGLNRDEVCMAIREGVEAAFLRVMNHDLGATDDEARRFKEDLLHAIKIGVQDAHEASMSDD